MPHHDMDDDGARALLHLGLSILTIVGTLAILAIGLLAFVAWLVGVPS